jgi:Cdc6-like AAA superfamily ATPase
VASDASDDKDTKTPKFLNDMKSHKNNEDYEMTDEHALMAPSRLRGFALGEKRWAFFLVENIQPVQWEDSLFSQLEVKGPLKETIKCLVDTHYEGSRPEESGHALSRKGKGLVILLYGPTGTGKTLTAGKIFWVLARDY